MSNDSFGKFNDAGLMAKQAKELADLRAKLTAFDKRLDDCISSIATVQSQTSVLPQMAQALKALVDAHHT